MQESFRPVSNTRSESFSGKLKFYGRMLLDLQILTIYRDVKKEIPEYSGKILDVGCGQSPYRFLLDKSKTTYFGIDIANAESFDYRNTEITPFNGQDIPFESETFEGLFCTEVLEHVENYPKLIDEIHRVMKPGVRGVFTIPWSARYHYIPYDFFRYTPSSLKTMFSKFTEVKIKSRGSDISVIANKVTVLWFRNLMPQGWKWVFVPFWVLSSPIPGLAVLIAHISLLLNLGSDDDPLGYTILVKK